MINKKSKLEWHTEKRKIKDLIPFEGNPRQMTEKQNEDLKKSLEKFDLVEIPAIDTDNKIIAGHQRLRILQALGRGGEEIDVRMPSRKLTDKEFREYNLRSNKNVGEFDLDVLANFEEDLLIDVGFDSEELDKIFDLDQPEDIDEIPELPEKAKSKIGEIYQLGDHRLLCGDATKKEDVEKLMGGEKANMVFTDPPYGMNLDTDYSKIKASPKSIVSKGKKLGNKWDKVIGDEKDFNAKFIFENFNYCKEIMLWGADYYIDTLPDFGKQGSWFVWIKRKQSQQVAIGNCFELLWSKKKHKRKFYDFEWFGFLSKDPKEARKRLHPTQKPTGLLVNILRDYSKRNQIVLDLFGGSGSTLIACEQLNRKCFMMEIDSKYTDVIIERYCKLTNNYDIIKNGKPYKWQSKS